MKIKLDNEAICPTRAHDTDAAYDLYTPVDFTLWGQETVKIDTGVHVQLPPGTAGKICSRSSIFSEGIDTDGLIDSGYRGSIGIMLQNHVAGHVTFHRGDRIAQMLIVQALTPELELVDELDDSDRGNGGFGSTGR